MKRIIAGITTAILLGTAVPASAQQELFNAEEINLLGFGTYMDQQKSHWGGGVGLQYFISRPLGIGLSTHWEDIGGSVFDNVNGELYLRWPLGRIPVAPYLIGTGGYDFERNLWFGGGGVGLEWRFSKEVGVFGDVQWLVREGGDYDGVGVRAGFRLAL